MKKINPLTYNSRTCYTEIRDSKHEPNFSILQSLDSKIIHSYTEYYEKKEELLSLNKVESYSEVEQKSLKSCYISDSEKTKKLKCSIKSISHFCPYCNLEWTNEIDHYIPKKEYPEYSVLNINLIPICTSCNKKK
ncbi:MAG: HNH endonuclease [Candidatus Peribacteria bacterium]|nr:MAG: HNH endonuclease [Candidatus Peribacteria bacterium]